MSNSTGLQGPLFYNTSAVLRTYLDRREAGDHPNTLMELPHILELAGSLDGREIADLGCGDARFGVHALREGASRYWGLEGAEAMAEAAREVLDAESRGDHANVVEHGRMEDWNPSPRSFDLVVSRMALHYVADLGPIFESAARALRPGGRFLFSVEHPVVTSCYAAADPDDFPRKWLVEEYFDRGAREVEWMGATSVKFHRTIEDHLDGLDAAGLKFVTLREGDPLAVNDAYDTVRRRRRHVPMYLIVAADLPHPDYA